MSFYRTFIAAVAALGLASTAFAAPAASTQDAMQASKTTASTMANAAQAEKININKATAEELAQVKGMSQSKAKAIVAYRKKHGDFKSVDDLKAVKGFKRMDEKSAQEIAAQLTVG